jgi:hypothetical protein
VEICTMHKSSERCEKSDGDILTLPLMNQGDSSFAQATCCIPILRTQ